MNPPTEWTARTLDDGTLIVSAPRVRRDVDRARLLVRADSRGRAVALAGRRARGRAHESDPARDPGAPPVPRTVELGREQRSVQVRCGPRTWREARQMGWTVAGVRRRRARGRAGRHAGRPTVQR